MPLLSLLNLLFFGPKVTLPRENFCEHPPTDVQVPSEEFSRVIRHLYGGRSLRIRVVNAGSNNAEELEIMALTNAYYDLERFGLSFVASPRHADMLFVTGPVTRNLVQALRATYAAAPRPCLVVAIGDGACTGGIWQDSYALVGSVETVIPVHLRIPGDPPTPTDILRSLLYALKSARL